MEDKYQQEEMLGKEEILEVEIGGEGQILVVTQNNEKNEAVEGKVSDIRLEAREENKILNEE